LLGQQENPKTNLKNSFRKKGKEKDPDGFREVDRPKRIFSACPSALRPDLDF
jgi:hypothetical protein